ncbi:N-terminal phage integrase SAM-like domain-containing protein [Dactylosporangium sp. CA-052675]|uniref:N-terminal phage integrase SAM-like domain-containing protein n=1 Tax=Dactylosporangium sp. CA-052675 TaxID=3239927 RepID=UPI003D8FC6EE
MQARSHEGIPAEATGWNVEQFLTHWLEHVVRPSRKPKTAQGYEVVVRVHLIPALGNKRLNRLTVADVRAFIKRFEAACLCCRHEVHAKRPAKQRRCCAVGQCCRSVPSARSVTPFRPPCVRNCSSAMWPSWCRSARRRTR